MGEHVDVTLWLAPQRRAAFDPKGAAALGALPLAGRSYVSRSELRLAGDADPQALTEIERRFRDAGMTHVRRSWRRVRARGSRSACAHTIDGIRGSFLGPEIVAVFGLTDPVHVESFARISAADPATGVVPLDVARAYRAPSGLTGSGTAIGIVHLTGSFHLSDLERAMAAVRLPVPRVAQAGRCERTTREDDFEIALDTQIAASVAPGATLVLYRGENHAAGYADAIASALLDEDRAPSVVSISYGIAEFLWPPGALAVIDALFVAAALCGVTVVVASGDLGSDVVAGRPRVMFPAASAFALACGGTTLRLERGSRISEVVWNDGEHASGGGFSERIKRPSWQTSYSDFRSVPDVAGHAAGYRIELGPAQLLASGTSAVAPLWAGFIALVNERLGSSCGFFTPLLYAHATPQLFHDVTSGGSGRYRARPGHDQCTGHGSPHFGALLRFLADSA